MTPSEAIDSTVVDQDRQPWRFDPLRLQTAAATAAAEYLTDFWQRAILYADVRRERGNQYLEYRAEHAPTVLNFAFEPLMSGADLPRPTNYWLARIVPPAHQPVDDSKRPFIIVDPRAGHGPGIGGFKPDSEIGAALKAGHPCYFIGFLPEPVRGQTVEDVMHAEAAFVRHVGERHPDSSGKPTVVGNCQAGWQILMTAAVWPALFGPIIIAGTPLSYWAGDKPMRHTGGLLGGSWLTALTSDLGAGRFDGAWLVQNFESLDPANTLWAKQYHVWANVDTEGPRYLDFEKYWGGLVYLDQDEIQYIVDNLFIGNKLATGRLATADGTPIDLRNIRSPIVVFCSHGDNITPPAQALGWITDLYADDEEVLARDQTIVYATHDSIGHLGIFVSGSVGRKEHAEFAANIDVIDLLPAGIYRAEVDDRAAVDEHAAVVEPAAVDEPAAVGDPGAADDRPGVNGVSPSDDPYLTRIRRSSVAEVRAIVDPDPDNDRRFAAAAAVSQANLALYRRYLQPWVEALSQARSTPTSTLLQPLRLGFEQWSDRHPLAAAVSAAADQVRASRRPASADNPFLVLQNAFSDLVTDWLDHYRDQRDWLRAHWFDAVYGSPLVQRLAGLEADPALPVRSKAPDSPAVRLRMDEVARQQREALDQGGLPEATVRALLYVLQARGQADERLFRGMLDWLGTLPGERAHSNGDGPPGPLGQPYWRTLVQQQGLLVRRHPQAAIAALPTLLAGTSTADREQAASALSALLLRGDPLSAVEQARLDEVLIALLGGAA